MPQMCPNCSRDNPDNAQTCLYCGEALRGLLGHNTLLEGRYRVTHVLGSGGMGAVYLADDTRIPGRQVAIKESLNTSLQAQSQFQSEVSLMVGLNHPGLPNVSDQFTSPLGRQYLVMDYAEGETLEDVVNRRGPLPEAEVITLVEQLLDVLEHLHSHSIIHRDVKPANIKLKSDGKPVLVDFGIAKLHAPGHSTQTWARGVGSPGFAPIEQYGAGTDARSDLYSLGAVMYYLLTGQSPPEAPDLAAGMSLSPPRKLRPDLSPHVQKVVFKAMALNPDQRFQSAAEMRQALRQPDWSSLTTPPPLPPSRVLWKVIAPAGFALITVALLWKFVVSPSPGTPTPGVTPSLSTQVAVSISTSGISTPAPISSPANTSTPSPTRELSSTPFSPSLITANNVARLADLARLDWEALDLAWSPDGQVLALATANGVALYEPVTLNQTRFITSTTPLALAFSPNSQWLLTGGIDNVLRLWGISSSHVLLQLEGHTAPVTDVAIDTRGQLLASSSRDNSVRVWNSVNGAEQHLLKGHSDWVLGITFSPDGNWLASGSRDRSLRLWDAKSGTAFYTFRGHSGAVTSVAISPDSRLLASGSEDGTVRLWDMAELTEVRVLKGHMGGVTSIVFNPSGRLLASGSRDGTVRLWDVESGVELRTLKGHTGEVLSVIFDPDGYWLISGSDDGTVRLWGVW
jgi:WD40 repeat protein/predicted Ser/Thr protein kinase